MTLSQVVSSLGYKTWNNINYFKLKIEVLPSGNGFFPLALSAIVFICYFFQKELAKLEPRFGWTIVC